MQMPSAGMRLKASIALPSAVNGTVAPVNMAAVRPSFVPPGEVDSADDGEFEVNFEAFTKSASGNRQGDCAGIVPLHAV